MNENKKMLIMGIIVIAIIATIPLTALITNIQSKNLLEKANEYIKEDGYKVLYIGRDNCSYCVMFEPEIELVSEEGDIEYLYVNTNKLKPEHLTQLLENLEIDEADFGTPYLVISKDGKIINQRAGYMPEDHLFEYLKENGVIEEEKALPLNYIGYQEYSSLITSNEKQLIVIAQSGCDGCLKARPVLYELADEYGIKINYLNVSMIDQTDAEGFQQSLTYFGENGISTPTMLVVQNSQVIDSLVGSVELNKYVEFLIKNGYIEK